MGRGERQTLRFLPWTSSRNWGGEGKVGMERRWGSHGTARASLWLKASSLEGRGSPSSAAMGCPWPCEWAAPTLSCQRKGSPSRSLVLLLRWCFVASLFTQREKRLLF